MAKEFQSPRSSDDVGQILAWIFAIALCGLLVPLCTGPAIIGALSVVLMAWFVGPEERQFLLLLAVVASSTVLMEMSGSGSALSIIVDWSHSYFVGFARGGCAGLFWVWMDTFVPGADWALAIPIGTWVGASAILARDARRNSPSSKLMEAKFPSKRRDAPLVRLRRWWVSSHLRIAGFVTLGTDFLSGARITILLSDLFRHLLLVGTTGSGKTNTVNVIIAECLRNGFSVLYLDGKGDDELARENCRIAESLGIPVYHSNANDPTHSCSYNPIATGDATSRASRVMAIGKHVHAHFEKLDLEFVQVACTVIEVAGLPIDLIQLAQYLDTKSLLGALHRKPLKSRQYAQTLATRIIQLRANEKDVSGLRADIRIIANSSLASLFDTRDKRRKILELAKARKEGAYVHATLPAKI